MNPSAVMISHYTRAETSRKATLAQLYSLGIHPIVTESIVRIGSDSEVKRMAWHAVMKADPIDGVLFFEDDLVIDPVRMLWFLAQPKPKFDLVVLCLLREGLYPYDLRVSMRFQTKTRLHIAKLDRDLFSADRGFHGSMALWLSPRLVTRMRTNRTDFMYLDGKVLREPVTASERIRRKPCGFDFWLKDNVMSAAVVFPNPVDHAAAVSTLSGVMSTHHSPSFGVPHV